MKLPGRGDIVFISGVKVYLSLQKISVIMQKLCDLCKDRHTVQEEMPNA